MIISDCKYSNRTLSDFSQADKRQTLNQVKLQPKSMSWPFNFIHSFDKTQWAETRGLLSIILPHPQLSMEYCQLQITTCDPVQIQLHLEAAWWKNQTSIVIQCHFTEYYMAAMRSFTRGNSNSGVHCLLASCDAELTDPLADLHHCTKSWRIENSDYLQKLPPNRRRDYDWCWWLLIWVCFGDW